MYAIRHKNGPLLAFDGESWVSLKSKDTIYLNPHWMQASSKALKMKDCRVIPAADLLDEIRREYPDTRQIQSSDGPREYTEKGVKNVQAEDIRNLP